MTSTLLLSLSSKTDRKTVFNENEFCVLNKFPKEKSPEEITLCGTVYHAINRLDTESSGCVLFAKSQAHALKLRQLFKSKTTQLKKIYLIGLEKKLKLSDSGLLLEGYIGSRYRRSKKSHFSFEKDKFKNWHSTQEASLKILAEEANCSEFFGSSYVVELYTGCRHQIRASLAALDHPLMGDPIYSQQSSEQRLELHARELSFTDPLSQRSFKITAEILKRS